MKQKFMKQQLVVAVLAGTIMIPGSAFTVHAAEVDVVPKAGIEQVLEKTDQSESQTVERYLVPTLRGEYLNRAFANIQEDFLYIRNAPDTESDWSGKLYPGNAVEIIYNDGEYTYISSGNVKGYVPAEELLTGSAAREYARNQLSQTAKVTADVLNVRDGQSTEANVLTQILYDEEYTVTGEPVNGWYPIRVGETDGWSCGDYLDVTEHLTYAESKEEEAARIAREEEEAARIAREAEEKAAQEAAYVNPQTVQPATGGAGSAVIDYACQFIGNPYVWGGTSLTEGCDCSGFVQSVYAQFGVSLPRTTWDMENVGTPVSLEQAMPGDLFLYDGHVGLYMGDGTIVNAMNEECGIGICDAQYTNIITIRRVI